MEENLESKANDTENVFEEIANKIKWFDDSSLVTIKTSFPKIIETRKEILEILLIDGINTRYPLLEDPQSDLRWNIVKYFGMVGKVVLGEEKNINISDIIKSKNELLGTLQNLGKTPEKIKE